MAKILVTGGAGYIGSHTVHALLNRGFDVVVVDDLSRGHRHNVDARRLREMRVQDTDALARLMTEEGIAAVMHFAAYIAVGESTREPELYFANNMGGTLSLVSAMARAGVDKMVFSSTAAVYGDPDDVPIPETAPIRPVSPYGESKAMAERTLEWLDRCRGLRSVSLRYFNACGAAPEAGLGEEHEPETHLIPLLFRAILSGEPITIFGGDYSTPDGTCIRDYVHVSDLAEAHVLAVRSLLDGDASAVYNVGTGGGYSVLEVLRTVEDVTGRQVPRVLGPRRAGDSPILIADATKLRHALGWTPRYPHLREIVETAWHFEERRRHTVETGRLK